jgi:membrane protein
MAMRKRRYFLSLGKLKTGFFELDSFKARIFEFLRHYFGGLYHRAAENHIFLLGGGLAFSLILCMVPFFLIVMYVLGNVLESAAVNYQLDLFVETIIPYSEYAEYVKSIIHLRADEVIAYKEVAGYIGVVGLFFAASGLFSGMRTALNVIFKSSGGTQAYFGKLRDLGMVLLVILFFVLSTAIFPTFEALKDSAGKFEMLEFLEFSGPGGTAFSVGTFLAIFILFFALYNLIPSKKPGLRAPALGALWATLLWLMAKEVFGYYVANVASVRRIYGTYMLFAVVTFWIYYTSVIFLVGAQIAQLYRERKMKS